MISQRVCNAVWWWLVFSRLPIFKSRSVIRYLRLESPLTRDLSKISRIEKNYYFSTNREFRLFTTIREQSKIRLFAKSHEFGLFVNSINQNYSRTIVSHFGNTSDGAAGVTERIKDVSKLWSLKKERGKVSYKDALSHLTATNYAWGEKLDYVDKQGYSIFWFDKIPELLIAVLTMK